MKKKYTIAMIFLLGITLGCTKEIQMDIPGFQEQLVVDGTIETGMPPIVILTKSKDIFVSTTLDAFLNGFISDANVFVSDGTNEYQLTLLCAENLPPGSEGFISSYLGIPADQISQYSICAYTSFNPAIWGQIGKNYTLRIEHEGKEYIGNTQILAPHPLDSLWWKEDNSTPDFGYSYATLSDPANQYDAYKWEVKRINKINDSTTIDSYYKPTFNSAFDDNFFDGRTFTFYQENPWTKYNKQLEPSQREKYHRGDTVVIKFSKIDKGTHDFLYSKTAQALSNGNPFASAINVKTNMQGGCLGVWAGYSPVYDTLICE